jgi:hypothetical protein
LTARARVPQADSALYLSDQEIGRLVMGERAREWPAIAAVLERNGLIRVDPLFGGRYFPAVRAFLDRYNGLMQHAPTPHPQQQENWHETPRPSTRTEKGQARERTR